MPGPFPLATLAAQVGASGITAPSYNDILASLQASMQQIYGADVYIAPDSQDGQLLAVFASAVNDTNNAAVATYNSFSPSFAQGVGLSSVVKINGIRRESSSSSSAIGDAVGVSGTVIEGGVVADENGNLWNLPASVTIPGGGSTSVTIIAQEPGPISAPSGTINKIRSPTLGWQSFASTSDATLGAPVESDAKLRQRQAASTDLPAQTVVGSIYAALANLSGVTAVRVYENPTGVPDADGLPAHSISAVVSGGDAGEIAEVIGQKKTPGAATYGTTSHSYTDLVSGIIYTINFYVPTQKTIKVHLTLHALAGFVSPTEDDVQSSVGNYLNGLGIGNDVQYTRLFAPAYLNGGFDAATYEVTAMTVAISPDAPGVIDLPIAFNEVAVCDPDVDITFTIT